MAGIQLGDIIQVSKAVWDLYYFGWAESQGAATQYAQFGIAFRGLAESLDSLVRVLESARSQVQSGINPQGLPRWNLSSLNEIIGDYQATINECRRLLVANRRYGQRVGPLRNIEWNILIQPEANALKERILLHNSKILIILKPLEIDLLNHIITRIDAVHGQVENVIGLLTSNVPQAIRQQQISHTLHIPPALEARFGQAAEPNVTNQCHAANRSLPELTEAFLLHLRQSTIDFQPRRSFQQQTAPIEEYINLLKCVWLMERIEQHLTPSPEENDSHWPSFIKGLKTELSRECWRFNPSCPDQILPPDLSSLSGIDFSIWAKREPENILPPIVQLPAAMMDELLNVSLETSKPTVVQNLRLLRGVDGKMSAIVSAIDLSGDEERRDGRTLDFYIQSASLIPLYAVSFNQGPLGVILRTDSCMAEFTFKRLDEMLRFQRALTGFKVYEEYSQPEVSVEFITSDRNTSRVDTAHIQLWISKELEGRASRTSESVVEPGPLSRQNSALSDIASPISLYSGGDFGATNDPRLSDPLISRLAYLNVNNAQPARSPPSSNSTIRESVFSRSPRNQSIPDPRVSRATSISSTQTTSSISMTRDSVSGMSSAEINSSGTSSRVTTVDHGSGRGYVHHKPTPPMLVLLLKSGNSQLDSQLSPAPFTVVTVQLDEKTAPNFERCKCQSHPGHCKITALERSKGTEDLVANITEASDLNSWDLMSFRTPRRENQSLSPSSIRAQPRPLQKLRRLTLTFSNTESRHNLSGRPCGCKIKLTADLMTCLKEKHQGLLGNLKQLHKKELQSFEKSQRTKEDVVLAPAS
ncbi:uncharacterized protein Z518_02786 [Rhinocladiella mackenziei CBS 650.93]|uniref:Rhinocladiella mackenziei CBS 650.93 unplaced genomic scaffold supercont1.2, whole genome shotgun sequence n=1 Tax=Rhinocladiella mackenziei CBS 650.93 TaxID=1442369 RepID=A0A0D2JFQ5_9EURO|nr:uncharacterized protein Z518_02786 [Rhinocladiella mackenziei CBS 650.93]KIX08130.1 hypothetical protein Z518_02786 [Rhinocladiella mackenziei CBS 650.93]